MLRNGELFFASPGELNDASECRPRFVFRGDLELWNRLANYVLFKACLRPRDNGILSSDEGRMILSVAEPLGVFLKREVRNRDLGIEELNGLFQKGAPNVLEGKLPSVLILIISVEIRRFIENVLPEILQEPIYVASFSKNATSPTMWGHYASAERGFVVVFSSEQNNIHIKSKTSMLHGTRTVDSEFGKIDQIGIYDEESLELKPVNYRRIPPKANAFQCLVPKFFYSEEEDFYDVPANLDVDGKEEDVYGLVKYSDWRYEQEIRAILPAYEREIEPEFRIMRTDPKNILGLIFGSKMSQKDKRRAILCSHLMRSSDADSASLPPFMFFQSVEEPTRFERRVLPVGILKGIYAEELLPLREFDTLAKEEKEKLQEVCLHIERESRGT